MTTIYGIILTLVINGNEYQTIPETFYTAEECFEVLQEIDERYGADAGMMFRCEKIED